MRQTKISITALRSGLACVPGVKEAARPGQRKKKGIGESSSSRVLFGHLLTLDAIELVEGKMLGVKQTDTGSFRFPWSLPRSPRFPLPF